MVKRLLGALRTGPLTHSPQEPAENLLEKRNDLLWTENEICTVQILDKLTSVRTTFSSQACNKHWLGFHHSPTSPHIDPTC